MLTWNHGFIGALNFEKLCSFVLAHFLYKLFLLTKLHCTKFAHAVVD